MAPKSINNNLKLILKGKQLQEGSIFFLKRKDVGFVHAALN